MNIDALRHFFDYHFAMNRSMWEQYVTQLTDEQFNQPVAYSLGSVREQIIHLIRVDEAWFSDLSRASLPDPVNPDELTDRASVRAYADQVEQLVRDYLANLQDKQLFERPLEGEDKDLLLWQVLLHVVNHGTDHRAQILRLIHDFGVQTSSQDYIFYVYDHP